MTFVGSLYTTMDDVISIKSNPHKFNDNVEHQSIWIQIELMFI